MPVPERPFLPPPDEVDIHLRPAWQRKARPDGAAPLHNAQTAVIGPLPFDRRLASVIPMRGSTLHREATASVSLGEVIPREAGMSVSSVLPHGVRRRGWSSTVETEAGASRFLRRARRRARGRHRASKSLNVSPSACAKQEVEDIVASEAQVVAAWGSAP